MLYDPSGRLSVTVSEDKGDCLYSIFGGSSQLEWMGPDLPRRPSNPQFIRLQFLDPVPGRGAFGVTCQQLEHAVVYWIQT